VSEQVQRTVSIRDGRTSTETFRRTEQTEEGDHRVIAEEFAVLDRAGAADVPRRVTERMLADGVVERTVTRVLEGPELERALTAALESPGMERLVIRVMESRLLDEAVERLLDSEELWLLVREVRLPLLAAMMAAFGAAISEVGASVMVGGNLDGETRVLTGAILLEQSQGDFGPALAFGIILLALMVAVNALFTWVQYGVRRDRWQPDATATEREALTTPATTF